MGQWLSPIKTLKAAYTHVYVVFRVFLLEKRGKNVSKEKRPEKKNVKTQ